MEETKDITGSVSGFGHGVASESNVDLYACYQCQKCTNGCPVSFAMDYHPHQVIRMVQLGLADEIAHVGSIWVCASCETCFTRCPNEIDIPALMDYLKQWVLKQGEEPVELSVAAFHESFMKNIRTFARIHEPGLMRNYFTKVSLSEKKVDIKEMIRTVKLGFNMMKRGRLGLLPDRTGGKKAVRELFDNR